MKRHFLALLTLAALPLSAQAPSEHWKTVTTPHFRFHYPAQYEAWTMRAASRMESVRAAVVKEVGYSPETVTDVLVGNPVADPNGATLPLFGHPRIILFTEAPDPELEFGDFNDWIDLLTVHETAHLIHLMRPSRNPLQDIEEKTLLELNPIASGGPRWLLEGYATVVEGRLTGSGRPNSSSREAILRKWAIAGHMPSYSQLSSDHQFLGMSMAYLAGSAFLEWLEARSGPDSLRHLWARMTARQKRSFPAAFEGVFGERPEKLYGTFVAELTQHSVDVAKRAAAVEGELWLDTKSGTGEPAVSPDGSQIALVERDDKGESKLVIYSTGPNEEEKKLDEKIAKALQRDPEDIAPVRTKPVARKALHTLRLADRWDITTPRWAGTSIVYAHRQPDRDGFLHHDLFVWDPATKENRRLTHLADVKDADPLPGAHEAIAVRSRFGYSQLVKVDLSTGAIAGYTEPSLDRIVTHPRASSDGHIAWSEHDASGWHIVVDGHRKEDAFDPEWGRDGALYAVVARNGFIDITRNGEPVTRSIGAAFEPASAPDGSIYFMSLETDGFVLRHLVAPRLAERAEGGLRAGERIRFEEQSLPPARPYGIGRQERGFLFGGTWTAYNHTTEAGVRLGDVVGRLDTLLIGATGPDRGVALASTWRGWPVAITAHLFHLRDDRGIELRAEHEYHAPSFTTVLAAGGSSLRKFGSAAITLRQRDANEVFRATADSDRHWRASAGLSIGRSDSRFSLEAEAGRRLTIGGFASSVVPESLRVERVDEPALPPDFAFAERFRSARIAYSFGAASLFWQRFDAGGKFDVRGVEIAASLPPLPIVKTAGVDFTVGVAKAGDLRGVKGWFAIRWRP